MALHLRFTSVTLLGGLLLSSAGLPAFAASAAPTAGGTATRKGAPAKRVQYVPSIADAVRAARSTSRELGVHVVRLSDGSTVFAEGSDTPRILASNTKLFTTAAALDALGPELQLRDRGADLRGTVRDGVLDGDLAVVGGGDPNISGRDSTTATRTPSSAAGRAALRARGHPARARATSFSSNGLFDTEHVHPDWPRDQLTRWYEAPVDALSFSDNCILVRVLPGPEGGAAGAGRAGAAVAEFPVRVDARPPFFAQAARRRIARAADGDALRVSGSVYDRAGPVEAWVTVPDPTSTSATALRAALAERGPRRSTAATDRLERLPMAPGRWSRALQLAAATGARGDQQAQPELLRRDPVQADRRAQARRGQLARPASRRSREFLAPRRPPARHLPDRGRLGDVAQQPLRAAPSHAPAGPHVPPPGGPGLRAFAGLQRRTRPALAAADWRHRRTAATSSPRPAPLSASPRSRATPRRSREGLRLLDPVQPQTATGAPSRPRTRSSARSSTTAESRATQPSRGAGLVPALLDDP